MRDPDPTGHVGWDQGGVSLRATALEGLANSRLGAALGVVGA